MIQDHVSAASELDDPLAELGWQFIDGAAHLRVFAESFHARTDRLNRALRRIPAFGRQKIMQPGHIAQGLLRPFQAWHSGSLSILTRLKPGEPGVGLFGRDMQPRRLVVTPGRKRVLAKLFAFLFASYILLHSLAHHPMGRAATRRGEPLHTVFQHLTIELQAGGRRRGRHGRCSKVLPGNTLAESPNSVHFALNSLAKA